LFPCESPLLVEFVATPVQLFEVRLELDLDLLDDTRSHNLSAATTGRPGPDPLTRGVTPTTVGNTRNLCELTVPKRHLVVISDRGIAVSIKERW
jgi:hypothetical protein